MNIKKSLLTTALTACMLAFSTCVVAQQNNASNGNRTDILPQFVQKYIKGEHSTANASFYGKQSAKAEVLPDYVKRTVVAHEDFSKWTAGSESEPDATDLTNDQATIDNLMSMPGWVCYLTHQAGGNAYFSYDQEHGPGYLKSPNLDLRGKQGVYLLKIRAKSVNPNAETQTMQIFSLDEGNSSIINAQPQTITSEWTECEYLLSGGAEKTSIMFYGNMGMVLVSDVQVEQLEYPLSTPQITSFTLADAAKLSVKWNAVEGATSYYVYATNNDTDEIVAEAEVTSPEALLTMDKAVDTEAYYSVRVTAKGASGESYQGGASEKFSRPGSMSTPVALAATNVSADGFTANWEESTYARQYVVNVKHKHTAAADGEEFVYLDDEFDLIPETATMEYPVTIQGSCDKYLNRGGWSVDVAAGLHGYLVLTNQYAAYGMPGRLTSPALDLSNGNGKVNVSLTAASMVDDVVLAVYFTDSEGKQIEGSKQTIDISNTGYGSGSVELTGGQKDSRIVFEIEDAAETGDVVLMENLKITSSLNKDEVVEMPYRHFYVDCPSTSYAVECPVGAADEYKYTVSGYFSDNYMSSESNEISVQHSSGIQSATAESNVRVYSESGSLAIENASGAPVAVYSADGRKVADIQSNGSAQTVKLSKGIYVVKAGSETYKVLNK